MSAGAIPVINIAPFITSTATTAERNAAAQQIAAACKENGFFYITGHGVSEALQQQLEELSREFFAHDEKTKMQISMAKGGRAWRGYFPVEGGSAV